MENGSNGGDEEKEVGVSHHGVKEKRDTSSCISVEVCGGDAHGATMLLMGQRHCSWVNGAHRGDECGAGVAVSMAVIGGQ